MSDKKLKSLKSKLTTPYKLIIYDEYTLKQNWSVVITRLKIWSIAIALLLSLVLLMLLLIIYTPINRLLPAYANSEMQLQIIENKRKTDSLEQQLLISNNYLNNLKRIIDGQDIVESEMPKIYNLSSDENNITNSNHDSILRHQIEEEEKFNVPLSIPETRVDFSKIHMFAPVKGILTNRFDFENRHFGIDLVASPNEPILAVLDGTVISATWTLATGYVIEIQHDNNLISAYKHNSALLKQAGDHVKAGESIAIIGNTGELSTGPHLHLELWHNGTPLNPEDYIVF